MTNSTIKLSAEEREFFAEVDFLESEVYRLATQMQIQQEVYLAAYNKFWDQIIANHNLDSDKSFEITENFEVIEDTEGEIDF